MKPTQGAKGHPRPPRSTTIKNQPSFYVKSVAGYEKNPDNAFDMLNKQPAKSKVPTYKGMDTRYRGKRKGRSNPPSGFMPVFPVKNGRRMA